MDPEPPERRPVWSWFRASPLARSPGLVFRVPARKATQVLRPGLGQAQKEFPCMVRFREVNQVARAPLESDFSLLATNALLSGPILLGSWPVV